MVLGEDPIRVVPVASISAVVLLLSAWPARAQSVPHLNVKPVCRGIAQQALNPSESGGPDLTFNACVKNEQAMREKARWRMVDIFAVGKDQLYRRADDRNGELYRSRQLPRNG